MKKIKLFAAISAVILLLVSCGSPESKIVGHWRHENMGGLYDLEFFSDGTYVSGASNYSGKYSISGDRLKLSGILVEDLVYTFKFDGGDLLLEKDSSKDYFYRYEKVDD